jgi:hypothetical protein
MRVRRRAGLGACCCAGPASGDVNRRLGASLRLACSATAAAARSLTEASNGGGVERQSCGAPRYCAIYDEGEMQRIRERGEPLSFIAAVTVSSCCVLQRLFTLLPVPLLQLSSCPTPLVSFSLLPLRTLFVLIPVQFAAHEANELSVDPTCELSVNISEVSV